MNADEISVQLLFFIGRIGMPFVLATFLHLRSSAVKPYLTAALPPWVIRGQCFHFCDGAALRSYTV